MKILTIGHSNRTLEEFLSLLEEFGISTLADIRSYPGSRKFPYFNREALQGTLEAKGINYIWFEPLGGRRGGEKNPESKNTGLRNPSFRNYADYMTTDEFKAGTEELLKTAAPSTTCVMCAEILYWRCHRKLVSDYLTAHNVKVSHILQHGKLLEHSLTAGAVISNTGEITYPPQADTEGLFNLRDHTEDLNKPLRQYMENSR